MPAKKQRDPFFVFRWWRAPAGYELVPPDSGASETLLGNGEAAKVLLSRGVEIRRRGIDAEPYRPDEISPPLHRQFADLEGTPDAMLDFVNKFGVLGLTLGGAHAASEPLDALLDARQRMSEFLALVVDPPASGYRGRAFDIKAEEFNTHISPHMTIRLEPTPSGRPVIKTVPRTLIAWMWLQVAKEISGFLKVAPCDYCGKLFEVSPSRKWREPGERTTRAQYCSNSHRMLAWRKRQEQPATKARKPRNLNKGGKV